MDNLLREPVDSVPCACAATHRLKRAPRCREGDGLSLACPRDRRGAWRRSSCTSGHGRIGAGTAERVDVVNGTQAKMPTATTTSSAPDKGGTRLSKENPCGPGPVKD